MISTPIAGDPQPARRAADEHVDHHRDEQHDEPDHEEAAPRAEVAAARTAYSDSTPNAANVSIAACHDARRALLGEQQERRDVDAFDEREQERQDRGSSENSRAARCAMISGMNTDERDERMLRAPPHQRLCVNANADAEHRDDDAEEDQPYVRRTSVARSVPVRT